jgi:hypothetical protein
MDEKRNFDFVVEVHDETGDNCYVFFRDNKYDVEEASARKGWSVEKISDLLDSQH